MFWQDTRVVNMATITTPHPSMELLAGVPHTPHELRIQESLPNYTPRARVPQSVPEREFEYKVEKKRGETVASMKVLSPAAYSKNIPTFCGTGPVKGSMNLYLKDPETITFVAISVRGRFLPGQPNCLEQLMLFDLSHTTWSKDANEPATNPMNSNQKLSGTHSWPFSFNIPNKIAFEAGSNRVPATIEHCIPQSFNERTLSASIQYEIIMHVGRGKFKIDYIISCTFGYFPIVQPPPFPALKTIAYQEKIPLLDPTIDLDGWIPAKKVKMSGILFKSRPVSIDCQLFLSAPLVYTRGSVIPLYVHIYSSDRQALDLLATHKALTVRLERRIEYCMPMLSIKNTENYPTGKNQRNLAEAVWWPAPSQEGTPAIFNAGIKTFTACLNGEIHLTGDLAPSTTLPVFTIKYYVCLSARDAPGFEVKDTDTDRKLLEHPVDIVTSFATGPRPVRHAPPGYNSERPLVREFGPAESSANLWW